MKKALAAGAMIFVIFIWYPQHTQAQDIGMNFYINFGVITDDSFSFNDWLWSGGAQLDFHIGSLFMISPECDVIIYRFNFDPVTLAPGIIANIKLSNLFLGAGVTKWFIMGDPVGPILDELAFKANVGIRTSNLKISLYAVTYFDQFFESTIIGITMGFGL
jgi:hypothetical protein